MAAPFDSSRAVRFDLRQGTIEFSDRRPHLLVPADDLVALATGGLSARALGQRLGASAMTRAAHRLNPSAGGRSARDIVRASELSSLVDQLGGELALLGLGNLRAECWGDVLLFVFDPCSLPQRGDELLVGAVEGAMSLATDERLKALVVDRSAELARIAVGSFAAISAVETLAKSGELFTEVVRALHGERPL
jgi:hypothetical protein